MPPKIHDRAYFSLVFLSPRTRSRRGKPGGRRARGNEADPRRGHLKKNTKLDVLEGRDSDTEADTEKKSCRCFDKDLLYILAGAARTSSGLVWYTEVDLLFCF